MKAGAPPPRCCFCQGHHVWDEDECLRCVLVDLDYFRPTQPTERES